MIGNEKNERVAEDWEGAQVSVLLKTTCPNPRSYGVEADRNWGAQMSGAEEKEREGVFLLFRGRWRTLPSGSTVLCCIVMDDSNY